jgi:competence protein ComEA
MSPGVFEVPDGSIVADAIKAAGGLRPGAMADAVNLAAPVVAGQQIIVTGPGTVAQPSHEGGDTRVSLNSATVAELDSLPGVGPVLAERIVEFREEHGLFTTVEDLLEVSGIGEAKLASIRDLVTVP